MNTIFPPVSGGHDPLAGFLFSPLDDGGVRGPVDLHPVFEVLDQNPGFFFFTVMVDGHGQQGPGVGVEPRPVVPQVPEGDGLEFADFPKLQCNMGGSQCV